MHCCDSCLHTFACLALIRVHGTLLTLCEDCVSKSMGETFMASHKRKGAGEYAGKMDESTPAAQRSSQTDVFASAEALYRLEAKSIGISTKQQEDELEQIYTELQRQQDVSKDLNDDNYEEDHLVWRNEFFYDEDAIPQAVDKELGRSPFAPSPGAIFPVVIRDGRGRIHVPGNIRVIPVSVLPLAEWLRQAGILTSSSGS